MKQIDEKVIALFNEQPVWYVSTSDSKPHVIPVAFKQFTADGKIAIAQVFMKETVETVKSGGKVAVAVGAMTPQGPQGYEIVGSADYLTEGPVVEAFKNAVNEKSGGRLAAKGVIVVTPETIMICSPGPDNGKNL